MYSGKRMYLTVEAIAFLLPLKDHAPNIKVEQLAGVRRTSSYL